MLHDNGVDLPCRQLTKGATGARSASCPWQDSGALQPPPAAMRAGSSQEFREQRQKDPGQQQMAPGNLAPCLLFLEGISAPHPPSQSPEITEKGDVAGGH